MGGLYNILHGYNPACLFVMPMLGRNEDEWPRFRDCYVEESDEHGYLIVIYTRVGGGNRNCGFGEEKLYEDPLFVETVDDDFDNTYAEYKFKVPEKWRKDFDLIMAGKFGEVSQEYRDYLNGFFPLLAEKKFFDGLWVNKGTDGEDPNGTNG